MAKGEWARNLFGQFARTVEQSCQASAAPLFPIQLWLLSHSASASQMKPSAPCVNT